MQKKIITRRDFIRSTSMVLAGGLIGWTPLAGAQMRNGPGGGGGGMGGGGGGMGGGGTTAIDPPVGALLQDPVEMSYVRKEPGLVELNLSAEISTVNVNGTSANLMTFNGRFPGPTIRARKGDRVKINYTNLLPNTGNNLLGYQRNLTNLHTHGWHVSPEPPADYVMYKLDTNDTYYHEYNLMHQEGGTFNFYHPHKHGVSAEQYWAGLVGALIVEDDAELSLLGSYETHILILKDISLSGSEPAPHDAMMDFMQGKEGNVVMVNGQVNPQLNIKPGQVQRWRVLNASNARFYRLSLENHPIYVIGTDGGLLDKPYSRSEIVLSPGERIDLLVQGAPSGSGSHRLLSLPYSRMGMNTSPTITLMTMTYSGKLTKKQQKEVPGLPSSINPSAVRLNAAAPPIAAYHDLALSMGQGNGYINGMDFDVDPYAIMSSAGTYEIWTIFNDSGMDHPFHQHVNPAQILSISGGDAGYNSLYTTAPAWKDTVLVPKWGSVTMLVPVMDYTGMAMFHCHILEHEDIGMMGVWHIMGGM